MIHHSETGPDSGIKREMVRAALESILSRFSERKRVLILPPDITRAHSGAGMITELLWEKLGGRVTDILPALGTHVPMTPEEISKMYGQTPPGLFREHRWRTDIEELGRVPASFISSVSGGRLSFDYPVQVNRLLSSGGHDLIISVGQVVPHEVTGMANYNKNVFVGCGGSEAINKSHFIGAVHGIENILGTTDNPVREVLNKASEIAAPRLPLLYILTVVAPDSEGSLKIRGLFAGDDIECFRQAAALSREVNFTTLPQRLKKVVVWLDPEEFKSTWLGNKSIYRTRMMIADDGELVVLAPGVKTFGEDPAIDRLIRKYGYRTTPEILAFTEANHDLQDNLSAAAHLIHGSPENRFRVTYAAGLLTREEVESVGYSYGDIKVLMKRYDPLNLQTGFHTTADGEEFYFISNPATGLWKADETSPAERR
ncbi:MAG: lactate racemase domain-containing protein [Bacteroidota bacterium]|nr:lactate racemase domain-containing protein [Bacteroidota bacterium]